MFPNPVSDLLTIDCKTSKMPEVFNVEGIRQEIPVNLRENKTIIEVNTLHSGVYLVKIEGKFYKFLKK